MRITKQMYMLVAVIVAVGAVVLWLIRNSDRTTLHPSGVRISRTSSGGIDGQGDGQDLTITPAGLLVHVNTNSRAGRDLPDKQLSASEQRKVAKAIQVADFFALHPTQGSVAGCGDTYQITLTISTSKQTHTVTYEDCDLDQVPKKLVALDQLLIQLSDY